MTYGFSDALSRLSLSERQITTHHVVEFEVQVGEVIPLRGDDDPALAWVQSRKVELRVEGKPVFSIGPGGVVGGEDVFGGMRRTFTYVASAPTRLAVIGKRELQKLRREVPIVSTVLEVGAMLTAMATWMPAVHDRTACANRCSRGVIRAQRLRP